MAGSGTSLSWRGARWSGSSLTATSAALKRLVWTTRPGCGSGSSGSPFLTIDRQAVACGRQQMREEFLRALQFRHACKVFDEKRALARTDLDYILEAGRLSPSSLGLEPWRFLVIEDKALRRDLRPACWNQSQVTTASALIVILALKSELKPGTGYAKRMLRRLIN